MREKKEQNMPDRDREQTIGQGSQQSKPTDAQGRPGDKQQGEKENRKRGYGEEDRERARRSEGRNE